MTGKNDKAARPLARLADSLAEDIFNVSDEQILAEFREDGGDPDQNAVEMRVLFEKSLLTVNKARMASAKAGAATSRHVPKEQTANIVNIADARTRLRTVLARADTIPGLTLAARKENELSDADVLGMLEELAELGLLEDNDDAGKS